MTPPRNRRMDLLTLASQPMPILVASMEDAFARKDEEPSRVVKVGDVILAEAIRLIRLGNGEELADAAVLANRLMLTPEVKALRRSRPGAHRALAAAAKTLTVAASPSSKGAELAVLRSWAGKARSLVGVVSQADGLAVPRARLKQLLGVDDSYLSHLLADLEATGLVERVKAGREVTVHLGPVGRLPHVQELVRPAPADEEIPAPRQVDAAGIVTRFLEHAFGEPAARTSSSISVTRYEVRARRLVDSVAGRLYFGVDKAVADGESVVCRFRLMGVLEEGEVRAPFSTEQVISAQVAGDEVVAIDSWSPEDTWPRLRVEPSAPIYESLPPETSEEGDLADVVRLFGLDAEPAQPHNYEQASTADDRPVVHGLTPLANAG